MRRKSKFAWYPDTFRNIWNRTREKGAKSGKRVARSFYQPTLELLEDRTLMAFSAVLSSTGLLTIDSTDDVDILLTTTGTPKEVKINGADPVRQSGTGPVLASQVTGIVVSDGDFANRLDLNVVISEDFTSLDSTVIITTAGGSDTIIGTAFKDSIVSGLGNDWIVPTWGTDTILTGDGDDTVAIESTLASSTNSDSFIDLGPGNDLVAILNLDGGEGDATIYGGDGNDTIDGGEGLDRISTSTTFEEGHSRSFRT